MNDSTASNSNINWNNIYSGTTASNTISFSTATTDTGYLWYPVLQDKDWLPYHSEAYEPKWHILLGYEIQIKRMWD